MRARMTSKGQITVPKEVREWLRIKPGDVLEFVYDRDRVEVRAVRRRLAEFRGLFSTSGEGPFRQERRRAWTAQTKRLTVKRSTAG